MNSTSVTRCNRCRAYFCIECTDATAYLEYCSKDCENGAMDQDAEEPTP